MNDERNSALATDSQIQRDMLGVTLGPIDSSNNYVTGSFEKNERLAEKIKELDGELKTTTIKKAGSGVASVGSIIGAGTAIALGGPFAVPVAIGFGVLALCGLAYSVVKGEGLSKEEKDNLQTMRDVYNKNNGVIKKAASNEATVQNNRHDRSRDLQMVSDNINSENMKTALAGKKIESEKQFVQELSSFTEQTPVFEEAKSKITNLYDTSVYRNRFLK